jgi:4-hydroxybenzoate polyprenyltransferase
VKTDLINHPDTVVVDRVIKRRVAIILHLTFTFIGIFIGMYAAFKTGYLRLAIFHWAAAILLWFYSTHLKKTLLIGNVVVSLLTASVAFMPFVFEMGVMRHIHPDFIFTHKHLVLSCIRITFIFSLFAFITSMAREVIKDMEDYRGDMETGGHTMPIAWGIRASKIYGFFLLVITGILLLFVVYNTVRIQKIFFSPAIAYILVALVVPVTFLSIFLLNSNQSRDFNRASLFLKFIMLLGLGYSLIFYYQ